MKFKCLALINLLVLQYLAILGISKGFDFFYFVQQWPGSYCDSDKFSCCYPPTGKPAADFSIHGLWPNYINGSYPQNCDPNNPFNESETSVHGSSEREPAHLVTGPVHAQADSVPSLLRPLSCWAPQTHGPTPMPDPAEEGEKSWVIWGSSPISWA
ncbi:hypothetical protein V6N11_021319 [Hibiscus sabdariffa]|uniref:Uncharacterized protein n=1 Tax=Hibiscus sabdariffa TaxID=183260 RepID=A0ABR2NM32_9ROSI